MHCFPYLLQSKVLEAETLNEQMAQDKKKYLKLLEEEQASSLQNQTRVRIYFLIPLSSFDDFSDPLH